MKADIIVIGPTGAGKSTLANTLKETAKEDLPPLRIIEGSSWIRSALNNWDHGPEASRILTEASKRKLEQDPFIALKYLQKAIGKSNCNPTIVVGLRNPLDFIGLYDPMKTMVVFIRGQPKNEWEATGLSKIELILSTIGVEPVVLREQFWLEESSQEVVEKMINHLNKC